MDTILFIASVKRVHGRATLTLSNGELIAMPRAMLKERSYRSGMPFDRASFNRFLIDRAYAFGLEKAVALLASRARTEKEIIDALRKNAYPETTIARVMARLHESGYINDADFAAQWTASRASKGLGTRRIRMELRQKGVDASEIDAAVSAIDEDELLSGAIKVAERAVRGKDLSSAVDRQKIIASLVRRGYDFPMAKRALSTLTEQE